MARAERDQARKRARPASQAEIEAVSQGFRNLEKQLPNQAAATHFWTQVDLEGDRALIDRNTLYAYLTSLYSSIVGSQAEPQTVAPSYTEIATQTAALSYTETATQTEPVETFTPAFPSASAHARCPEPGESLDARALHLRIVGLPESSSGSDVEDAERFLIDTMRVASPGIETAYRVGIQRPDRPRHILVCFRARQDRLQVLQHGSYLRGTSFSVQEDLTLFQLSCRREELCKMREARSQRKWAVYRGGAVIVRDQWPSDPWLGY